MRGLPDQRGQVEPAIRAGGLMPQKPILSEGWLTADGCKIGRVQDGLVLAFHDKDRRRSSIRGSNQVEVSLVELLFLMAEQELDNDLGSW